MTSFSHYGTRTNLADARLEEYRSSIALCKFARNASCGKNRTNNIQRYDLHVS